MSEPPAEWDAVFFDIGGVIVSLPAIRAGYVDYVEQFAAERGLDPEPALEAWRDRLGEHFKAAEGREYRSAEEGYRKAFQHIADGDIEESAWRPDFERTLRAARELEPNAAETIRGLDDAGLYLGIISDIDTAEAHRMLEDQGLDTAFEGITTSQEVGYKKPDGRMFEDALSTAERHGVDPARSLMVGDRYEHDMRGGTEAGLWTVAYGGTAAENAGEPGDGYRVDDEYVDFVVEDLADVLEIVGADGGD
ncbi:HAD family hydrolase [Salinirussus salinus]|uniref:HAD family hydrolase n=1 Tax=Salinirussus salinus TaxID=1198300 RepID=UPI001356EED4|nr:HAD family hydrolase [Salinirussus salinus]